MSGIPVCFALKPKIYNTISDLITRGGASSFVTTSHRAEYSNTMYIKAPTDYIGKSLI